MNRLSAHGRILSELTRIVEAGALKPVLDERVFRLSEAAEAHTRLESGKPMGKVVIENKRGENSRIRPESSGPDHPTGITEKTLRVGRTTFI